MADRISTTVIERIKRTKERLEMYYMAEEKILNAQEYRIGSRSLTRADLDDVQSMIRKLEAELEDLETRGTTKRQVRRAVFYD